MRQSMPPAARFDVVAVSLLLAAFCRAAAPQEASGPASEVITTVAGTSLSYHVAEPEELDGIIRDVASHVQVLWVGVEGWDKACTGIVCCQEMPTSPIPRLLARRLILRMARSRL